MIYVDTNYWVYWFDARFPEHRYVRKVMLEAVRGGIVQNYVTLVEIAHYLRPLSESDFKDRIERIMGLQSLRVYDLDSYIYRLTMELLQKHKKAGIGARDAVILATMKASNTRRIATHDSAFKRVGGVEVIDPIPK